MPPSLPTYRCRRTREQAGRRAFDRVLGGPADAAVGRIDPAGESLTWSTYLGGMGSVIETGHAIVLASPGVVYVCGSTHSGDFPTTDGAFDPNYGGGLDAFVAALEVP